ncbi:MAG: hypothetical protein JWN30_1947, partial [Bacilli bacterium]|nr:hypothetical protein [Bacilli bacterium]
MQIANQPLQVKGYAQGGTVVNGIAYFTANSYQEKLDEQGNLSHVDKKEPFPYLVAFDVNTLEVIRTYPFENTYDSTPLVIQNQNGQWLVLAHEYTKGRTVAMYQETGEVAWISEENQPGGMFFGFTFYRKSDGTKLILVSIKNGLHALSLENGQEQWLVPGTSGVTPCVDQGQGLIYWQSGGKIHKIEAETGKVLAFVPVYTPSVCVSWNTVLAKDEFGTHIVTYWYSSTLYGSAIRVYDAELNLEWEKKGLPMSKKASLTYH